MLHLERAPVESLRLPASLQSSSPRSRGLAADAGVPPPRCSFPSIPGGAPPAELPPWFQVTPPAAHPPSYQQILGRSDLSPCDEDMESQFPDAPLSAMPLSFDSLWSAEEQDPWASLLNEPLEDEALLAGSFDKGSLLAPADGSVGGRSWSSSLTAPSPSSAPSSGRDFFWSSSSSSLKETSSDVCLGPMEACTGTTSALASGGTAGASFPAGDGPEGEGRGSVQGILEAAAPAAGMAGAATLGGVPLAGVTRSGGASSLADHVKQVILEASGPCHPATEFPESADLAGEQHTAAAFPLPSQGTTSGGGFPAWEPPAGLPLGQDSGGSVAHVAQASGSVVSASRVAAAAAEVDGGAGEWSIAELKGMLGLDGEVEEAKPIMPLLVEKEEPVLPPPSSQSLMGAPSFPPRPEVRPNPMYFPLLQQMQQQRQRHQEAARQGQQGQQAREEEASHRGNKLKRGTSDTVSEVQTWGGEEWMPGLVRSAGELGSSTDAAGSPRAEGSSCLSGSCGPSGSCGSPTTDSGSGSEGREHAGDLLAGGGSELPLALPGSRHIRRGVASAWHNKAAQLLQRSQSDWSSHSDGRGMQGPWGGSPPSSGLPTAGQGLPTPREEENAGAAAAAPMQLPAQAVDGRSRPADLSDRLAAVIDRLYVPHGVLEEPLAPANLNQSLSVRKQQEEFMRLPSQQRQLLVLSSSSPAVASSQSRSAKAMRAAEGKAGGLKRDARRKKGRFAADPVESPPLLPASLSGVAAPSFEESLSVASYFKTCDVEVSWQITPGGVPSPGLPLLQGPNSNADAGFLSPRDLQERGGLPLPSMSFGWGKGRDMALSALASRGYSQESVQGLSRAGSYFGPGLLPGAELGPSVSDKHGVREQLMMLAESYATDDMARIQSISRRLTKRADRMGSPDQRLAYYFLQALEARADGTATEKFMAPIPVPAEDLNKAMGVLCKVVPFLQTCQMVNHEVILEATAGSDSIHILALGIWHGDNWGQLFKRMAARPGGPPQRLRISGVDAPLTPGKLAIKMSSANVVLQVKAAAASAGLHAEVEFLQVPMEKLRASAVGVVPGETLVAFCSMRMQLLPDGAVVRANPRDSLLQAVHELKPKVFLLEDLDANFNAPFFLSRFKEAMSYYGAVLESVDSSSLRNCPNRATFEEMYFARDIMNVVACEGLHRLCRSERFEQWTDRFRRMGFRPASMPTCLPDKLRSLYACRAREAREGGGSSHPDGQYQVVESKSALQIGWRKNRMLFAAVWEPA